MTAYTNLKKICETLTSDEYNLRIAERNARVYQNIAEAEKIRSDLLNGIITEEEAKEKCKELYDRTYR